MAVAQQLLVPLTLLLTSCSAWATDGKSRILKIKEGASFTVRCISSEQGLMSMDLLQRLEEETHVLHFYEKTRKVRLAKNYEGRVKEKGEMTKLSITLINATADDSGIYSCVYNKVNAGTQDIEKFPGMEDTLVVVMGGVNTCPPADHTLMTPSLLIASAISGGSVFLLCVAVLLICLVPRVKKFCARKSHRKAPDLIYEDMGRKCYTPG
ncbi:uncharacterized protein LOC108939998 [Scleropages formosus]|uniref:uncharacterized protein LOC108939998 n=1 Tax=Scleropages formosus TaxID=113540 RepID=UPI0008784FBE|nr:uncharacterized protein LOC108939998 [Scleropages formosus]